MTVKFGYLQFAYQTFYVETQNNKQGEIQNNVLLKNDKKRTINAPNKKSNKKGPDRPFTTQDAMQDERRSTVLSSKSVTTIASSQL